MVSRSAAVAIVLVLACASDSRAQSMFAAELHTVPVPFGEELNSIAVVDLDRDGKLDVLTSWMTWAKGDGLGDFAAPVALAPLPANMSQAGAVLAADIDRDGLCDIVITGAQTGPQGLWIYRGLMGGGFAAPALSVQLGSGAQSLHLGNFDGDAWPDIAGCYYYGGVFVLRDDGAGGFLAPAPLPNWSGESLDIGDLDGDGDDDIVTSRPGYPPYTYFASDALIFRCNGQGGFVYAGGLLPANTDSTRVDLCDLDGDGDLDLVTTSELSSTGVVRLHLNDGAGNLGVGVAMSTNVPHAGHLGVGDFDGDGDLDIVCVTRGWNLPVGLATVLANSGNATFPTRWDGGLASADELIVANVDGDRRDDLIARRHGFGAGFVVATTRTADRGRWLTEQLYGGGPNCVLDLEGDGDLDLIGYLPNSLVNDGHGVFAPGSASPPTDGRAVPGDLDGDGDIDLVTRQGYSSKALVNRWMNDGAGNFGNPVQYRTGLPNYWFGLADVDGDAELDLVTVIGACTGAASTSVAFGDGAGGFATPVVYPGYGCSGFSYDGSACFGDFDGDGRTDIAAISRFAVRLFLFPAIGAAPTIVDHQLNLCGSQICAWNMNASCGDVDGDGALDLLIAVNFAGPVPNSADLVVLRGDGAGGFPTYSRYSGVGPLGHGLATGDFNADGNLDVALTCGVNDLVCILLGDGAGAFSIDGVYADAANDDSSTEMAPFAGDFDLDGRLDLITRSKTGLMLRTLELADTGVYCTAKQSPIGCSPAIAFSGDPSASQSSGFIVSCANVVNQTSGLLFYGVNGSSVVPFQGGTRCVALPNLRTPLRASGGSQPPTQDCSGAWSIDLNAFAAGISGGNPNPALAAPGTHVHCQWWGRDPTALAPKTALSDALQYTVGP